MNEVKMGHLNYEEAKAMLIEGLTDDAAAHLRGDYQEIGVAFDDFDGGLPRGAGDEFDKLFVGLNFWDGWIDARNHDWLYYEGINESDWPKLAEKIIASVKADVDISDPVVLERFG